jgi:hypothetical protein
VGELSGPGPHHLDQPRIRHLLPRQRIQHGGQIRTGRQHHRPVDEFRHSGHASKLRSTPDNSGHPRGVSGSSPERPSSRSRNARLSGPFVAAFTAQARGDRSGSGARRGGGDGAEHAADPAPGRWPGAGCAARRRRYGAGAQHLPGAGISRLGVRPPGMRVWSALVGASPRSRSLLEMSFVSDTLGASPRPDGGIR